ncbi:MAG: hypothetical protein ABI895_29655 [Deltaproteobacteria bacterium]
MRAYQQIVCHAIGILLLGACQRGPEPAPAAAPAPASEPKEPDVAPAPLLGARQTSKADAMSPPKAKAPAYPMCSGQHLKTADAPRSGAMQFQLAPAFLDEMTACSAEDGPPKGQTTPDSEGHINAKGDCEFTDLGISCHYHSGSEFVTSSDKKQKAGQGELHCIVPSDDPKSPNVYGAHITCRHPEQGFVRGKHASHEIRAGESCSSAILTQLETCQSFRCCDDGTLTNPIADLTRDGRNDIRPDFRICSDTLKINCDLLANMTPHNANSPALGGVATPRFAVSPPHDAEKISKKH